MSAEILPLAENLWVMRFPLSALGAQVGRNVTIIRLRSGKLVIHSTAPFTMEDITTIREWGEPAWLIDAMCRHDTFSIEGHAAFPEIPYLVPEGFTALDNVPVLPLLPSPSEWKAEFEVLKVEGVPKLGEHVFLHRPSETLIVSDLLFNFGKDEPIWTKLLLKLAVGGEHTPGVPRSFKLAMSDKNAFLLSMEEILAWPFNRIIVGHGSVIANRGKEKLRLALQHAELASADEERD